MAAAGDDERQSATVGSCFCVRVCARSPRRARGSRGELLLLNGRTQAARRVCGRCGAARRAQRASDDAKPGRARVSLLASPSPRRAHTHTHARTHTLDAGVRPLAAARARRRRGSGEQGALLLVHGSSRRSAAAAHLLAARLRRGRLIRAVSLLTVASASAARAETLPARRRRRPPIASPPRAPVLTRPPAPRCRRYIVPVLAVNAALIVGLLLWLQLRRR